MPFTTLIISLFPPFPKDFLGNTDSCKGAAEFMGDKTDEIFVANAAVTVSIDLNKTEFAGQ